MDRDDTLLTVAIVGVILQAIGIWQNRKRKPRRGRHRRE